MKQRYTVEQIINAIKEHEAGAKVSAVDLLRSVDMAIVMADFNNYINYAPVGGGQGMLPLR